MKKVTYIIFLITIVLFSASFVYADGIEPPPTSKKKGNFSKETFSKKNAWSENNKAVNPPDPNSGEWGPTAPISNGLAFLIIGSVIYFTRRVRENEE